MTPLAIDLFCGLGGWTEGLLAEGYRVVGFDLERHSYPVHSLPERPEAEKSSAFDSSSDPKGHNQRINRMRDALKGKEVIGWQEYPAQLVLQDVLTIHGSQFKDASLIVASPPCQEYSYMAMPWSKAKEKIRKLENGEDDPKRLTALFDACFRIQREACEASGRYIPLVVENVRGAQKWVGSSRYHFGSFHLWGDVPALMPMTRGAIKVPTMGAGWYPPDHPKHVPGLAFNGHAERAIRRTTQGNGVRFTTRDCGIEGVKQGGDWFNKESGNSISRRCSSKSPARKMAAAHIAKIPLVLAQHIAKVYKPNSIEDVIYFTKGRRA